MDSTALSARVEYTRGRATVYLNGEIDMATAGLLTGHLNAALQSIPSCVCADLSAVRFCDCHGIACLLDSARRARRQGTRFITTGVQPIVLRLVDIFGLRDELGCQAGQWS